MLETRTRIVGYTAAGKALTVTVDRASLLAAAGLTSPRREERTRGNH